MEKEKLNDPEQEESLWQQWESESRRGRLLGGIFIIAAGGLYLARELGVWMPEWLFTWQMLIITIGVFIGAKHSFRSFGWVVLVLVGLAFMLREFAPWLHFSNFFWPVSIILVGIFTIFKPKRSACKDKFKWNEYRRRRYGRMADLSQDDYANLHEKYKQRYQNAEGPAREDFLEFNAVFGGIRKNVITKTFRGGEVNAIFGGAEINLMHADFTGTIELEVNSIFGGTRLIIPSNWTVKSEVAAVMGSVEDKRMIMKDVTTDPDKVLILRGNAIFGGIEIQSYS